MKKKTKHLVSVFAEILRLTESSEPADEIAQKVQALIDQHGGQDDLLQQCQDALAQIRKDKATQ